MAQPIDRARCFTVECSSMLRFTPHMSESDLRDALVECGRICYERRLMTSNDGNLSVRLGDTHVLITPAGVSKGRMSPASLLLIELSGKVVGASELGRPSSETPMHLEVYKNRPDAGAVIHAHPVFATALTVAGLPFPDDVLPETALALGHVPVTGYATPSTRRRMRRPFGD